MAIDNYNPQRPVPVMHFHGKADNMVPFAGPSGRTPKFLGFIGKSTKNISANDLIWEFFEKHPMK